MKTVRITVTGSEPARIILTGDYKKTSLVKRLAAHFSTDKTTKEGGSHNEESIHM